jgi:hypothetical protein
MVSVAFVIRFSPERPRETVLLFSYNGPTVCPVPSTTGAGRRQPSSPSKSCRMLSLPQGPGTCRLPRTKGLTRGISTLSGYTWASLYELGSMGLLVYRCHFTEKRRCVALSQRRLPEILSLSAMAGWHWTFIPLHEEIDCRCVPCCPVLRCHVVSVYCCAHVGCLYCCGLYSWIPGRACWRKRSGRLFLFALSMPWSLEGGWFSLWAEGGCSSVQLSGYY